MVITGAGLTGGHRSLEITVTPIHSTFLSWQIKLIVWKFVNLIFPLYSLAMWSWNLRSYSTFIVWQYSNLLSTEVKTCELFYYKKQHSFLVSKNSFRTPLLLSLSLSLSLSGSLVYLYQRCNLHPSCVILQSYQSQCFKFHSGQYLPSHGN